MKKTLMIIALMTATTAAMAASMRESGSSYQPSNATAATAGQHSSETAPNPLPHSAH
jgi:hypothetical protein